MREELRRFLAEEINSPEQLEILLLLHREAPREWTAQEISQQVYTVPAAATMSAEHLAARGLLAARGTANPLYRYEPRTDELRARMDELAEAYTADRVGVIKAVFETPADPLRTFADAFRLRGDR